MKFIKFAILATVVFGLAFGAWSASDPKVQQRRQEEARAKADKSKADRQATLDAWSKWIEEAKRKNAERPKAETDPNWKQGFEAGYLAGQIISRGGSVRPDSAKLDAMSRKAATANGFDDSGRAVFCNGYFAGFSFGWDRGK